MVDGLDVQMGKGRCKWVYAARQRYATLLLGPYWGPIRDPWAPIGGSPWNLEVFRCGIHLTPTTSSVMQFGHLHTTQVYSTNSNKRCKSKTQIVWTPTTGKEEDLLSSIM